MKLLVHNMLNSHVPDVPPGLHFLLEPHKVATTEANFNRDLVLNLYGKLDWAEFRRAAATLGLADYPESVTAEMLADEDFLRKLHHGLLEVTVEEGFLICPHSQRRFRISKGIPNLLLSAGVD